MVHVLCLMCLCRFGWADLVGPIWFGPDLVDPDVVVPDVVGFVMSIDSKTRNLLRLIWPAAGQVGNRAFDQAGHRALCARPRSMCSRATSADMPMTMHRSLCDCARQCQCEHCQHQHCPPEQHPALIRAALGSGTDARGVAWPAGAAHATPSLAAPWCLAQGREATPGCGPGRRRGRGIWSAYRPTDNGGT